MTFISYAQNYEDVMLWRALKHIEKGFYIDVGAFSPNIDSVTRAFYDRGWRGINVEPNKRFLAELNALRPEDLNLGVAISDKEETLQLYVLDNPGLTTLQSDIAKTHQDAGWQAEAVEVQAQTLTTLWVKHVDPAQPVHFLKVDVEGNEAAVLRGLDWKTHRPWIVVVEATFPMSQREVHDEWEDILLQADYQMAYWDGLNRFYVAEEHQELLPSFSAPPNVFDDFQLAPFIEMRSAFEKELAVVQQSLAASKQELHNLSQELKKSNEIVKTLESRPLWHGIFFRSSGRPKKPLRRLLFHSSGKPRGMFKKWVFHKDGRPRAAFIKWMESDEYRALPRAIVFSSTILSEASLSERGLHFLSLLKSKNER
ncbi:MAG: FkbM family methyltransferase [Paracoccaceae bacterium]